MEQHTKYDVLVKTVSGQQHFITYTNYQPFREFVEDVMERKVVYTPQDTAIAVAHIESMDLIR